MRRPIWLACGTPQIGNHRLCTAFPGLPLGEHGGFGLVHLSHQLGVGGGVLA